MTVDAGALEDLRDELGVARGRLRQLAERAAGLLGLERPTESDVGFGALIAYNAYHVAERLFEIVAREFNASPPKGPAWHRELLRRMTSAVPGGRPAVISEDTHDRMIELLGFRHLVRNLYVFDLKWGPVRRRLEDVVALVPALDAELGRFDAYLAGVRERLGG